MLISPGIPSIPPPPPVVNQQQAALATASVVASQVTAKAVETQTVRAPAAIGRSEASRGTQSSAFVGYAFDREANVLRARTPSSLTRGRNVNISA